MTNAIIGGAIAAVIGAVGYFVAGLWLEHHREKSQKLTIVDALITETAENLVICKHPEERGELWWASPFKLEIYHAYKNQLSLLPLDMCITLSVTASALEKCNNVIEVQRLRVANGAPFCDTNEPIPIPDWLVKDLESVNKELRKLRVEHTRSLALRIRHRLRNFISKIRKNSGLRHT